MRLSRRAPNVFMGQVIAPWDPFADLAKLQSIPLDRLIVAEVKEQYAGFLYWFVGEKPWFDPQVEGYAHITEVQVYWKDTKGKEWTGNCWPMLWRG